MADKIMDLIPTMTKAKALDLILDYVDGHGIPELDTVVYTEKDDNNINQWTYQGLCKFLINES